jgi:transcriptional regulator with XRE-family HTH domain
MDPARTGHIVRQLRVRLRLRQVDLAGRAGVSPRTVGRVERGDLDGLAIGHLERIVRALGGSLDVTVRWHGGDLDRTVNARHSAMHEALARWFRTLPGWVALPEVSFSVFGERGVVDVVAWHAATRTLLVIELKAELVDIGGLLAQVDRYRRLAPTIARDRGWRPDRVATWVLLAAGRTNARRLAEHANAIRAALPHDGRTVARWLVNPVGPLAGLSFLPDRLMAPIGRAPRGRRRVDRPREDAARARNLAGRAAGPPTAPRQTAPERALTA